MKKTAGLMLGIIAAAVSLGGCGAYTGLEEVDADRYVTLGQYKELEVSAPVMEVTDEYIQNYIGVVLSDHAEWVEVSDRPAQMGDTVNIDYVGTIDGEAFYGGTDDNYDLLLGSGAFIPGFEEGLVGAGQGEKRDVPVTFPDPYYNNPDMSGAEAVFAVTVNSISERRQPELTDEFVQSLDVGCRTVDEYREYVRSLGEKSAQETYEKNVEEALIAKVMADCTVKEPPKGMVDQYYDRHVRRLSMLASVNGITLEDLVTAYGSTMKKFEEEAREELAETCRRDLILRAIAEKENIVVTQEEIDAAASQNAESDAYTQALYAKVMAFLKDNAVITES